MIKLCRNLITSRENLKFTPLVMSRNAERLVMICVSEGNIKATDRSFKQLDHYPKNKFCHSGFSSIIKYRLVALKRTWNCIALRGSLRFYTPVVKSRKKKSSWWSAFLEGNKKETDRRFKKKILRLIKTIKIKLYLITAYFVVSQNIELLL